MMIYDSTNGESFVSTQVGVSSPKFEKKLLSVGVIDDKKTI